MTKFSLYLITLILSSAMAGFACDDGSAYEAADIPEVGEDEAIFYCADGSPIRRLAWPQGRTGFANIGTGQYRLYSAPEVLLLTGVEAPAELDFDRACMVLVVSEHSWFGTSVDYQSIDICQEEYTFEKVVRSADASCPMLETPWHSLDAFYLEDCARFDGPNSSTESVAAGSMQCTAASPGLGEPCTHASLCQPELVCAGLTRAYRGRCLAKEQLASFETKVSFPIPDADPAGIRSENPVEDFSGACLDLLLSIELHHPRFNELEISLEAPDGQHFEIDPAALEASSFTLSLSYTGPAQGLWSLSVVDHTLSNIGELVSWRLTLIADQ